MSSPFKTFEEFSAAKAEIYSYAHVPWVTPLLLVLSVLILLWFIIASYQIKH